MRKLEVFDPPMCCSTGICGESSDPTLMTFASDLEWLKVQGVSVERIGLSLEPARFTENEDVKATLCKCGNACLPLLVVDGTIVSKSCYPTRKELAALCKVEYNQDEAPPVHREENCCCGTDCDCDSTKIPQGVCHASKCDCSSAPAEQNCFCCGEEEGAKENNKIRFIVVALIILTMIVLIAARYLF